ncbi:hypothetical protein ACGFI9_20835 [Micromonospora sp. NPDC048930]|uniref:hypothetical protein n=1 Tax=Micromonospora sp. NPDC048930 TaxID=3364261 RepID=UPI0037125EDC
MPAPTDPRVARVLAEEVLRGQGTYAATPGALRNLFRAVIADSPAATSPTAAVTAARLARGDLAGLGIAVRRRQVRAGQREWVFTLGGQ